MATKRDVRRRLHAAAPAAAVTTYPNDGNDPSTPGEPGIGQPLQYASDLAPWRSPQYVPGAPQRMPGFVRGPVAPLIGAPPSATTPTPGVGTATVVLDPHHYANVVEATTTPSATAGVGTPFLTQPAGLRNYLELRNPDTNTGDIFIGFQNPASSLSSIRITPGQTYLWDTVVPQNDLYAFGEVAGELLVYSFSNIAGALPP